MTAVHTIDLHYLGHRNTIASYLIEADEPALIETGPASTLDALRSGLASRGYQPADIKHVFVTHIHLDHAGAAGWWAEQGATIYVHGFGAKHLIDPSKLIASAERIYGDQMDRLWGAITPVPESQVRPLQDDDVIEIDHDVCFTALETPGHARHHHAFAMSIHDERICFTGDAAAMIVPGTDFIAIPTPPPEFNLEQWLGSIERLRACDYDAIYPTHFGRLENAARHFDRLKTQLIEHSAFIRESLDADESDDERRRRYAEWVRQRALDDGVGQEDLAHFVSDNLLNMNVTGIARYWTKKREAAETNAT